MTKLWSTADVGALIAAAALTLVAVVLALETGRRRLRCWKADRMRAAKLAEDAKMATRAGLGRASFVRAAEELAARNAQVADRELEVEWPTVGDLAAAAVSPTEPLPVIQVPSPRTSLYVVPQLPETATA
jgi:hypothetical protein